VPLQDAKQVSNIAVAIIDDLTLWHLPTTKKDTFHSDK